MNVFGVGPMEMGLVIIIAVVVLGPERFPEFAVQIAKAIKFLRGYANEATTDLRSEFQELTREYEEMRKELNEVRTGLSKTTSGLMQEVTSVSDEMRQVATETRPKIPAMTDILGATKPIIEPGGDLPPDRANGSNGTSH